MDPAKMKVVELRAELTKRGLDTKGNKPVLMERLRQALDEDKGTTDDRAVVSSKKSSGTDDEDSEQEEQRRRPPRTPSRSSRRSATPTKTPTRSARAAATTAKARLLTVDEDDEPEKPKEEKKEEKIPKKESVSESAEEEKPTRKTRRRTEAVPVETVKKLATPEPEELPPQKKSDGSKSVESSPQKAESKLSPSKTKLAESTVSEEKVEEKPTEASPTKKSVESVDLPLEKEAVVTPSPKKTTEPIATSPQKKASESVNVASPKKTVEAVVASPSKMIVEPIVTSPIKKSAESVVSSSPKKVVIESPTKKVDESVVTSPVRKTTNIDIDCDESESQKLVSPVKPIPEKVLASPRKESSPSKTPDKPALTPSPKKRPAESIEGSSPSKKWSGHIGSPLREEPAQKLEKVEQVSSTEITSPGKKDVSNNSLSCEISSDGGMIVDKQDLTEDRPKSEDVSVEENAEVKTQTEQEIEEKMLLDEEDIGDVHEDNLANDTEGTSQDTDQNVEMKEETTAATENTRKRFSSSSEEPTRTPPVSRPEDEPEIDTKSTLLSWYDSDLNLVINKDGFLSAAPMNGDGFYYMWAGARASYGFTSGKVLFEARIDEHCPVNVTDEECPHALRVGWSVGGASLQLGEGKLTFAYGENGTKSTNNEFTEYGPEFDKGDIIGCYADFTAEDKVTLSFTMNGTDAGTAFSVTKEELGERPLFPHVLSKNCAFSVNFGQEERWCKEGAEGFVPVGVVEEKDRIAGPQRPEKKEDCEVIMMCGLPSSGKTFWATKYAAEHQEFMYNILGTSSFIEKMKILGVERKQKFQGRWETLIEKCTRALNKMMDLASTRRRNYILDQTNVYPSAQRRKIRNFYGFKRRAVMVVPSEEEYKNRLAQRDPENKDLPDTAVMEMKANISAPTVGESFDVVEWAELDEQEGKKMLEGYNKEGKSAGYGQNQHQNKRSRFDKGDARDNRDSRNNRDSRHRRFPGNRNHNSPWRGNSSGGGAWRDRAQRGSHSRHSTGYSNSPSTWRSRGGSSNSSHRGTYDRRGNNDRRGGNDRNRTSGSHRRGGWDQSGYQGSQSSTSRNQGGWQDQPWASGQSGSRGGNGNQAWGGATNWKAYQSNYDSGYNQNYDQSYTQNYDQSYAQDYGNDGWFWDRQQQLQYYNRGQSGATPAAGGQAASTTSGTMSTTSAASTGDSYDYSSAGWQDYTQQTYSYTEPSAAADAHQNQQ